MFGKKSAKIELDKCPESIRLSEQPTIKKCLEQLCRVDLKVIPAESFLQEPLILKENVYEDDDKQVYRVDYIMTPLSGVRMIGESVAVEDRLSVKIRDIVQCFTLDDDEIKQKYFQGKIRRFITQNGAELFTFNDNEILEVLTESYCKRCKECNEISPTVYIDQYDKDMKHNNGRTLRFNDVKRYTLKPGFLKVLFDTKAYIAAVSHPCQEVGLHDILNPSFRYRSADPPKVEIVFPKER